MMERENIKLKRKVEASMIPSGEKMSLPKDSMVEVTQALGGSYTVVTERGYMVRIDGEDADALGKKVEKGPSKAELEKIPLDKLVWDQLKTVFDPEIPVDIANLGLVYTCEIQDIPKSKKQKKVFIQMTLTAPGCGMGDTLCLDVQRKVEKLPNVKEVKVELVWEPQWNQSMMSDVAKLKLGMM